MYKYDIFIYTFHEIKIVLQSYVCTKFYHVLLQFVITFWMIPVRVQ